MQTISRVYPYLAGVGLTDEQLSNICIKQGKVLKITGNEEVTVEVDSVEYDEVPVWIHTDCGARLAAIKAESEEEVDPADYFKDAALMFPLSSDITVYDSDDDDYQTVEPLVFVMMYTDPGTDEKTAVGIIQVVSSITQVFDPPAETDPFRTWRPYVLFSAQRTHGEDIYNQRWYLYDLINDTIASIPTFTDGAPVLPFFDASAIANSTSAKSALNYFISQALHIRVPFWEKTDTHSIGHSHSSVCFTDNQYRYSPGSRDYPYYTEDGTLVSPGISEVEYTPPPSEHTVYTSLLDSLDGEETNRTYCGSGTFAGDYSLVNGYKDYYEDDHLLLRFAPGLTFSNTWETPTDPAPICPVQPVPGGDWSYYPICTMNMSSTAVMSSTVDGNVVVSAEFLSASFIGYQEFHEYINQYGIPACEGWNDRDYTQSSASMFEVMLLSPDNLLWNCTWYSLYIPAYYNLRTYFEYVEEPVGVWYVPTHDIQPIENVKILDNVVFNEDSYFVNYSGLSDFMALALRNLCVLEGTEDWGVGTMAIEISGIYFVPFNMDIALLE